jgi:hypothetical protein
VGLDRKEIKMKNKYNFFVPGRLPNLNDMIFEARGNKYASAVQKKLYTKRVADVIRLTFRGYKAMGKVWLSCHWLEINRRRDPDNVCAAKKYILDGMVVAGLLDKDGWDNIGGFTDTWEVGKDPGVWVEVREI